ncbi:MAG: methyl-accepting chemotaxis protein [Azonexus sp.]|jgi:methyl-accepting chemotaxis protein|nr:methyl-accepting chemotaxis protein [Azonexus sp.]
MSIAKRLMLLIGFFLAAIAILIILALGQMSQVFTTTNYGNENTVPSLRALERIEALFYEEHIGAYRLMRTFSAAQAKRTDSETRLADTRKKFAAAVTAYETNGLISDARDKELYEKVKATTADYDKALDTLLAMKNEDAGYDFIGATLVPFRRAASAVIDEQIAYNIGLSEKGAQEAKDSLKTATIEFSGIGLFILVIGAFLGLRIARGITRPLAEVVAVTKHIANGDLTVLIDPAKTGGTGKDEISQLKQSTRQMQTQLQAIISKIVKDAGEIADLSTHLSAAAAQVSTSIATQSDSTTSAAAVVEELTVSLEQVSHNSQGVSAGIAHTGELTTIGNSELDVAVRKIKGVAAKVEETGTQVQTLSDHAQEIGNITTVIREVADQTNLLALNAAIEAARAGEQGRGFAVVADEVRKLAERTTQSVQEITKMINTIQESTGASLASMTSSRDMVHDIVATTASASKAMGDINTSRNAAQQAIDGIAAALCEQRSASADLAKNIQTIAHMSEQNASAVESVAGGSRQLLAVSERMKENINRFRL